MGDAARRAGRLTFCTGIAILRDDDGSGCCVENKRGKRILLAVHLDQRKGKGAFSFTVSLPAATRKGQSENTKYERSLLTWNGMDTGAYNPYKDTSSLVQ